ncbi:substrate-binding domain-containing protein [Streptomyces sp. B93]|uniref:substrate-binding domain-containing protein n=1 Tax=Streptomyces sp. B93 TaxID=2824875 RepID=UPI001B390AA6|nr:substrate-binding domain-containing protein [Streptomyces sp. B93]MBQ1094132.1 substrate-binding domain-containing protein [Streptomyces sp. B93]
MLSEGYLHAMERHGLAGFARIHHTAYSDGGGFKAGMTLLTADRPPTAVMTGADVAALGVHRAAHELGLRIPRDPSLVGYNNTALAAPAPGPTDQRGPGGTHHGVRRRMLVERVESRRDRPMQTTMTPRLVVRSTTGAPQGR